VAYKSVSNRGAKRYERIFLERYDKTTAVTLFKKYSELSIIPKGKSLVRDRFLDLLKLEGPIIASWIAVTGDKSKEIVNNVKKLIEKSGDEELSKFFSEVEKLADSYKKIISAAEKEMKKEVSDKGTENK
jgi:hypothetical protein